MKIKAVLQLKKVMIVSCGGLLLTILTTSAMAAAFSGALKRVTITDPQGTNKPPIANFTYSINGNIASFNASGSTDADGTVTKYGWDFGDNTTGTGFVTSHQYREISITPVTLTVEDDKGSISIAQKNIALSSYVPTWIGETAGKNTWTLIYVNSQETVEENGSATNAFDNNPNTIWHTEWSLSDPPPPHEILIDLNKTYTLNGLRYLPRQDNKGNGTVCNYEFYVSSDKNNWGTPVLTGTFDNNATLKEAAFTSTTGRYVHFRATRECNNSPWTSMAEIDFQGF